MAGGRPAGLLVALVLTFTRNAWVGACAASALLLAMKDFRLLPVMPIVAAVFFALAPPQITARFYSISTCKDPTNRDRVAMLREGVRMVGRTRSPAWGPTWCSASTRSIATRRGRKGQPAPAQRAAADRRRARPARARRLAVLHRRRRDRSRAAAATQPLPVAAAGALAAIAGMLAAGLFEYNFGDSEFLMLFLVAGDAALRGRTSGPAVTRHADAAAAARPTAPALSSIDSPARRCSSSATSCSIGSSSGASIASRPRRPCRSCCSIARSAASAAPPTSRTTCARSAGPCTCVGIVGADAARRHAARRRSQAERHRRDGLVTDPDRPTTARCAS